MRVPSPVRGMIHRGLSACFSPPLRAALSLYERGRVLKMAVQLLRRPDPGPMSYHKPSEYDQWWRH